MKKFEPLLLILFGILFTSINYQIAVENININFNYNIFFFFTITIGLFFMYNVLNIIKENKTKGKILIYYLPATIAIILSTIIYSIFGKSYNSTYFIVSNIIFIILINISIILTSYINNFEEKITKKQTIEYFIYPTEEIRKELKDINFINFHKNIRLLIVFFVLLTINIILALLLEGKFVNVFITLLTYSYLVIGGVRIYKNYKELKEINARQYEIVVNEKLDNNLEIINRRNRFNKKINITLFTLLTLIIIYSVVIFIIDIINKNYGFDAIVTFLIGYLIILTPVAIILTIIQSIFTKKQVKLIRSFNESE